MSASADSGPSPGDPVKPSIPAVGPALEAKSLESASPLSDDILRTPEQVRDAILVGQGVVPPPEPAYARRRRVMLPLMLFLVTCASTFAAGLANWEPEVLLAANQQTWLRLWHDDQAVKQGYIYMGAVIGILLFHEMGHFVMTVRHRIPASLPFFIPLPIHPFGTMGAVIGMEGMKANRRQLFDIGIAGPLAGLLVAIPVTYLGVLWGEFDPIGQDPRHFHPPLMVDLFVKWLRPDAPPNFELARNPWYVAGWIGLLITGLNMMPISQLDGGHVIYALFRRGAHLLARLFLISAILFVVMADAYIWSLMLILVILIGTDHPPTSDDSVELGPIRWTMGVLSLAIPVLCFPPMGMTLE